MRYGSMAAALLTLAAFPGIAHGVGVSVRADTVPAPARQDVLAGLPSGTFLSVVLARLERGKPVDIAIAVALEPPPGHSAGVYAARYGIPGDLAQQIIDTALAEGIDPDLGFRLVRVESVFEPRARGPRGALGLTQLMPSTARAIDRSVRTHSQILEPSTNLRLGFRYLRRMIERYDGNVRLGLLAYNRGEGSVDRSLRAGRDPENGYSHKVLGTRGKNPYRGPGLLTPAK